MRSRASPALRRARRAGTHRALQVSHTAETRYVSALRGIMRGVHAAYVSALAPTLPDVHEAHALRQDAANKYGKSLDVIDLVITAQLPKKVGVAFDRMSATVAKATKKALGEIIGITPHDTRVGGAIAAARDENIRLVEDAARAYAKQVREVIDDPANFAARVEDLADRIAARGGVSESRAELIARDQTLKLNGKITEIRQTNAGVTSYSWSTSRDERVRPEHAALEGRVYTWGSGGEPGIGDPGEDYQCRCCAIPIVAELDGI